jgi:hypothetical protein
MNSKLNRFTPLALSLGFILGLLALLSVTLAAVLAEVNDISISAVTPTYGWNDGKPPEYVYIEGNGFEEPLTVTLRSTLLTVIEVQPNRMIALVPSGMTPGLYNLTVEIGSGSSDTLSDTYKVLQPTTIDDLTSFPNGSWLWTEPKTLRVGYANSGVGLNVQRLGGLKEIGTLMGVTVKFVLKDLTGDQVLGNSTTSPLPPDSVEATGKVIWEPKEPGRYTICATIDPDNKVDEKPDEAEDNNEICRTVTVLDIDPDITGPIVYQDPFQINDGAPTTAEITATLDTEAEDSRPRPNSGMDALYFIEYEYNLAAGTWMPVQYSDWEPYAIASEDYPWTLLPTYGVRYMRVWGVDKAGNISRDSKIEDINLLPSEQVDSVLEGEVVFYRYHLYAGQTLSATLTPKSGDPDLYIWSPGDEPAWYSDKLTGVETVQFEAPVTGVYQIEVHGYTDAEYRLTFEATNASAVTFRVSQSDSESEKVLPTGPSVSLDDVPSDIYLDPPEDQVSPYTIYLPMTIR